MNWKVYKAGADLTLFSGALKIFVVREQGSKWMAFVSLSEGIRVIARESTREKTMEAAESWLEDRCDETIAMLLDKQIKEF